VAIGWDSSEVLGAEVTPLWGVVPMCLLHFVGTHEADIWIRAKPSSLDTLLSVVTGK
jgi:hypothetical protein